MREMTKWGLFIGDEVAYKAFVAEMERREKPTSAPAPKTEEVEKPIVKRKTKE